MARLRGHRALDYGQPLYVLRASWTVAGRTLVKGDVFDWRSLGIGARKVHQFWDERRVGHEQPGDRAGAESVSALVSPAPTALPAATVQPDTFEPHVDHSTAGQKRTIVIDGEPMEFTSGPTVHVETPAQRQARTTHKRR